MQQTDLFGAPATALPEGFRYQPDLLTQAEQHALVGDIAPLPFMEFEFQGFLGKRRIVSYGWKYDFTTRELRKSDDIPAFLLPLRERAAAFAGLSPEALQQVLVTECDPKQMDEVRRNWPFLRDRRVDAYAPIANRWLD